MLMEAKNDIKEEPIQGAPGKRKNSETSELSPSEVQKPKKLRPPS